MQYQRVCAYISKEAIKHNFDKIKKLLPDNVKIMPVIKADGYGHGANVFAELLEEKSDYFAVAIIEEAIALREHGVKKPILLLGYTAPVYFEKALQNDITVTILSYEDAVAMSQAAVKINKTAKIHIPVDTGMSRIGFTPDEFGAEEVLKIASLKNICIEGVFTHFATADEADKDFTKLQAERFTHFKNLLEARNVNIKLYHCANSGAIMQHGKLSFDMMRAGIILYGLYPSEEVDKSVLDLIPVMELKTHVAFVKTIKKGDSVSYGRTFTADKDMKIATIPVGYADGYPRLLSNKGRVIINGSYAPIVGRICMDQFMVDVSHIETVKTGDEVVLIGKQNELFIGADEVARLTETINYEVTCNISKRVPREVI